MMEMISEVIVDTNVLVALIDDRDNWSQRAKALITAMYEEGVSPIFLDCVINESVSVLARRSEERRRSDEFVDLLDELTRRVPATRILWASTEFRALYDEIIALVRRTHGAMNFHDAFIAVACRAFDIQFILSFDRDFDQIDWLTRLADEDAVHKAFSKA